MYGAAEAHGGDQAFVGSPGVESGPSERGQRQTIARRA